MVLLSTAIFYILVFLIVYMQVFFFVTFLEHRKKIVIRDGEIKLTNYKGVTIIVPSFNEETTIHKTVTSLLDLNYPKEHLQLILIDDGSTDNTWDVMQQFSSHPNIKVLRKENGGKYTALNLGLEHTTSPFVGCLDADSLVDKEALVRIMSYFEQDSDAMAVVPSVVVDSPKGILQNAQRVEYNLGIYLKKMYGFLGAIHVTPGPFTIFKTKVFKDLGPYRHAHNTEDMEIAYRMQLNKYKIEHCNDAYVYTKTPINVKKFFVQRLRWTYGSINNTLDYRHAVFNKNYGNFSFFTLPTIVVTFVMVIYIFSKTIYHFVNFIVSKIVQYQTVGFNLNPKLGHFDLFFFNTQTSFFLMIITYSLVLFSIIMGRHMIKDTKEKWGFPYQILYFFIVFGVIAPFWIIKALYITVVSRRAPAWR
ncbi:MAG: glycosyltransferase family 2 protein [Candidatus Pacebacteria bacterium]|nr:glycosyltransferase family 2 protein [Candidatus Paceibacterota bacterium]